MPPTAAETSRARNLLLATDLGAHADRAEARAVERARALGARLHVVTVDETSTIDTRRPRIAPKSETLEGQLRELYGKDLEVEAISESGEAWRIILREAVTRDCELVVLGPADPTGLQEKLIGSTAERVMHAAPMPVLTVRRRARGPYTRVIAATDFSDCSKHALIAAASLLPEATFMVTHAYRVPYPGFLSEKGNEPDLRREAERDLADFMMSLGDEPSLSDRVSSQLRYGTLDEVFAQCADEDETDLIVVGSHGSGGTFDKLLGGSAERLIGTLPCDVLVTRSPRASNI